MSLSANASVKIYSPRRLQPCLASFGAALATLVHAGDPAGAARNSDRLPGTGDFVFSILPKAFQQNPELEMTVVTEFTAYGRLQRPVSATQPAYFVAQTGGYRQFGDAVGGEHSPPPADLERAITKALALNGFLPATLPAHVPTLAVIYTWGSHNKLSPEMAANFPDLAAKQTLERAILVGGKDFASGMGRMMEFGETILDHTERLDYLRYQASDDLYFVVASAYDYRSIATGKRQLVWRTSMTVNSKGVSMKETLMPLIATAAPFLGRETAGPEIAMRRMSREGRVEIGTATVVEDKDSKSATTGGAAPAAGSAKNP